MGLSGIIGAFVTGVWTLSGAFTALGVAKLFSAGAAATLTGAMATLWATLSPILLTIGAGIAIVAGVVGGLTLAWHSLK